MKECNILSLDIWDTILRRKCHPDEIKLATARFLYLHCYGRLFSGKRDIQTLLQERIHAEKTIAQRHRSEEDDEYHIRDVFAQMLLNVMAPADDTTDLIEELYNFELEREKQMCYLDPGIIDTVTGIHYKKLVYISDFYAGTDFIDELLAQAGFPFQFDYKFVSCEYMRNKRSGNLYKKAMEVMGSAPADQFHLGDNKYSDVDIPKRIGIQAFCYQPGEQHAARKARESCFSVDEGHALDKILEQMTDGPRLESVLAPFFMNFVLWIMEDCARRKIRKIYYFTREGEFFVRLHELIASSGLFLKDMLPEVRVLEVSRIATFGASLRSVTLTEMMRLWNQYSVQSMRAFAKSVAIAPEDLEPWLEKVGVSLDEMITYPWMDERIEKLFSMKDFVAFFEAHIAVLRSTAMDYFHGKGLLRENPEQIAIVDIGWRGTIQDNLCYLFPEHQIQGYYLALEEFLNEQPKNGEKTGYLNGLPNYRHLLRIVAPIEMLCNSPNGSTIGYERLPGGCIRAVRKNEPGEDQVYEQYTRAFQGRLLERALLIGTILNIHSICSDEMREATYRQFSRILLRPQKYRGLVEAFFQLKHNEEFGVGGFVDKKAHLRLDLMAVAVFSKRGRRKLVDFLNETSWPQGYLVRYRLDPLVDIYNRLLGVHW